MTRKTRSAEIIEELEVEYGEHMIAGDLVAAKFISDAERVFDFTVPVEAFDAETQNVYYRLRRVAIMAGDEGRLPDGKTYAESEVIEILGEDYAIGLVIDRKCCG